MKWLIIPIGLFVLITAAVSFLYYEMPMDLWRYLQLFCFLIWPFVLLGCFVGMLLLWRKYSFRALVPFVAASLGLVLVVAPAGMYGQKRSEKFLLNNMQQYMQIVKDVSSGDNLAALGYAVLSPCRQSWREYLLPDEKRRYAPERVCYSSTNGIVTVEFRLRRRYGMGGEGYVYRSNGSFASDSRDPTRYYRIPSESNWAGYHGYVHNWVSKSGLLP